MAASVANPWVLSVQQELALLTDAGSPEVQRQCSVYRVPDYIRTLKQDKYDCGILPLGLYNRDFNRATLMDRIKLEVVSVVLKHLNVDPNAWNTFCSEVAEPPPNAPSLENFYHDPPSDSFINREVVLSVLTIDAVFITAIYRNFFYTCLRGVIRYEDYEPLHYGLVNILNRGNVRWYLPYYCRHIWSKFENQIPLFLMENILKKITKESANFQFHAFLRAIVFEQLDCLGLPHASSTESDVSFDSCDHLLACLHTVICMGTRSSPSSGMGCFERIVRIPIGMLIRVWPTLETPITTVGSLLKVFLRLFPSSQTKKTFSRRHRSLPTVSELRKAGIHVRGIRSGARSVQFVKSNFRLTATLCLPQIDFNDCTDEFLLNLFAYELMTYKSKILTVYLVVLDNLINTEEDVLLLRNGNEPVITCNYLGEDKMVADVINNMLQHFTVDVDKDFDHLKGVMYEIHAWYGTRWRHQLTHFIERFVKAPWIVVTFIAATLLLTATILQTVYAVVGFYKH